MRPFSFPDTCLMIAMDFQDRSRFSKNDGRGVFCGTKNMNRKLIVTSLVLFTVTGCASGYQRDVRWCQERYFGMELEQCLSAAQNRAQREEQRR